MKYFLNIVSFFLIVFFLNSCDNRSRKEIYIEELITPPSHGVIKYTELWKGGSLVLYFKKSDDMAVLKGQFEIFDQIKKGDFFKKKANSNKCLLKRKDSMLCFDCFNYDRMAYAIGDSLAQTIEKWDRKIVNKWYAVSDSMNVKTLLE